MTQVLSVILGGGQGSRLFPLTRDRSKPAVPLIGKYRLIDVPISNCIHSGYHKILVLTQFNSTSLHRHISLTYNFDAFDEGFVQIMAAQQTLEDTNWYQGTADAVRQNMRYLTESRAKHILILSGDQLYRMDFRKMVDHHTRSRADITVAVLPVTRVEAHNFGVLRIDNQLRIVEFVEKPKSDAVLDRLEVPREQLMGLGLDTHHRTHLASMGIYIFNRTILPATLSDPKHTDFGKEIIPSAISKYKVGAYVFDGYWEDVGTVGAYYRACLDCTTDSPHFDFNNPGWQIYTRHRHLPPTILSDCVIHRSMIAEGCKISGSRIDHSLMGIRSMVGTGTTIKDSIVMGCDYYEQSEDIADNLRAGIPNLGIGRDVTIHHAIIDKNARIGDGVMITNPDKLENLDGDGYYIRDGIIVVPKNGVILSGTHI